MTAPLKPASDADVVERMRVNAHYRIGFVEACLENAKDDIDAALRLIPDRPTHALTRKLLAARSADISRVLALTVKANHL